MFDNNQKVIDLKQLKCHSGGATGADTLWEELTDMYGGKTYAYSYKTAYHDSPNKVEITDKDYEEGVIEVKNANKFLKRKSIDKYMHLLSRDWQQVKCGNQTIAVGKIKQMKGTPIINGGTGYGVMMSFIHNKPLHVFDQDLDKCFEWSYITNQFKEVEIDTVKIIYNNFTGIGTRALRNNGENFIRIVFKNTIESIPNNL